MYAVLVTRGDVDLSEIVRSLTGCAAEIIVWNNDPNGKTAAELVNAVAAVSTVPVIWANTEARDLSVYGRYAALRAVPAGAPVLVQDDDCVLPPASLEKLLDAYVPGELVCNMPAVFRAHYSDSGLVGFGALFDAPLPNDAFARLSAHMERSILAEPDDTVFAGEFLRCCDVVFTALAPMTWIDVPYDNLPHATAPGRMYRQPGHVGERARMLTLARTIRGPL